MFNTPSFDDTLESFTSGDTDDIDHFIVIENGVNFDFFFEVALDKVNFLSGGTTIDLNFENVIFLLSQLGESFHLGSADSSNNGGVFFDSVHLDIDGFFFVVIFFGVFGESFFLRVHPIFIKSS